jgi:hypothetical protein
MKELKEIIFSSFKKELFKKANWLKNYEPEKLEADYKYITAKYNINGYTLAIQGDSSLENIRIYSFVLKDKNYAPKITANVANIISNQSKIFEVISKMKKLEKEIR